MSQISDAIMSSMAQQFDPQAKAVADYMKSTTEQLRQQNEFGRLELIARAEKLLAEAKGKDNVSTSVLDAYERMLMRVTS